jgi:hypothetical protein
MKMEMTPDASRLLYIYGGKMASLHQVQFGVIVKGQLGTAQSGSLGPRHRHHTFFFSLPIICVCEGKW